MPSNHSSPIVHYWAGKYPKRIGWLLGPSSWPKTKLRHWIPYALDNDAFIAWSSGRSWDVEKWRATLNLARRSGIDPLWALVPDVVADRKATLANWDMYSPEVESFGWPLAFAAQDGMTPDDVPPSASVVFMGGTTQWKWRNLPIFARSCQRIHVGRVNELRRLWTCEDFGVESVDGSGWFRDSQEGRRIACVEQWLDNNRNETIEMELQPQ